MQPERAHGPHYREDLGTGEACGADLFERLGEDAEIVEELARAAVAIEPRDHGTRQLAPWIAGLLFRRLARKRPVLLVRGALSDIITGEIADRMQRQAPRLKRVDVPNVGHAPMLSEPAAVDAIDKFLRTVP